MHNPLTTIYPRFQVRIGDNNLTGSAPIFGAVLNTISTTKHPKYTDGEAYFDVGIITTDWVEFSHKTKPICLHDESFEYPEELDYYSNHAMELIGKHNI